jgi:phenylpropionate dioxygenase-like ring-hydroxylating dioxygenase large terminal subunit
LLGDWHVVAFSTDLRQGKLTTRRLLGRELVLWRDRSGTAHVWEDLCIHRGSRLSKGAIVDDTVVCGYHGWRFDCSGKCTLMPATPHQPPPLKARAVDYRCEERYGFVWVCLSEPLRDLPAFPEWGNPEFIKVHAGEYLWCSSGFRAVENFTDITHFPFVHDGVNGVLETPDVIGDYSVETLEDGLRTSEIPVYQPYGDPREVPVRAGYTYRIMRPLVAYFSKRVRLAQPSETYADGPDDRFCTFFTVQAMDETSCVIRICTARNFGLALTEEDVRRRQDLVYTQDRDIVETQRPERIPLDLREELHVRSDRFGRLYRQWLDGMGVTYGALQRA